MQEPSQVIQANIERQPIEQVKHENIKSSSCDSVMSRRIYYDILKQGDQALEHGHHANSTKIYGKCIQMWANNPIAYIQRGKAYLNKGEIDMGYKDLNKAISLSKDWPLDADILADALYNLALLLFNRNLIKESLKYYDECIQLLQSSCTRNDSLMLNALNNRGFLKLETENDPSQALQDFEEALKLDGNHLKVRYNRARAFMAIKKYEQASEEFQYLIDKFHDRLAIIMQLIDCHQALGNNEQLMYLLEEMIQLTLQQRMKPEMSKQELAIYDSALHRAYNLRAKLYQEAANITEAMNNYTECIRYDRRDADAWINRAMLKMFMNDYHDAIYDLTIALNRSDDENKRRELEFIRAQCYEKMGQWSSAIIDYHSVIDDLKNQQQESKILPELYTRVALLHLKNNVKSVDYTIDVRNALRCLRFAIESSKETFVHAYYHRSQLYLQLYRQQRILDGYTDSNGCDSVGYHERALRDMNKVIDLTLDKIDDQCYMMRSTTFYDRGVLHVKVLHRHDFALQDFISCLEMEKSNSAQDIGRIAFLTKLIAVTSWRANRYFDSIVWFFKYFLYNKKQ